MKGRAQGIVAVLAVVAATAFHVAPLVAGPFRGAPRHIGGVVVTRHWPDLSFLCESLSHFEIASWNPYEGGGYPFHGTATAGAYDPLRWALCGASGFSPGYLHAEARCVLGLLLAGLFGLLWLRRVGFGWGPSLLGALAIQAAPALRHDLDWADTAATAYLPLVLWAIDRAVEHHRLRDAAMLALATALCGWSGSIWALGAACCLAVPYAAVRLYENVREQGREALTPGVSALIVGALGAGGLLAAAVLPDLASTFLDVGEGDALAALLGTRASTGAEEAVPWAITDPAYPGLLVFLLAPLALIGRREWADEESEPKLGGRWLLAVVALAAGVMALGAVVPAIRALVAPLWEAAPWPAHVSEIPIGPAVGGLAAAGLSWLGEPGPAEWFRRHKVAPLVAVVLLLGGSFAWLFLGFGYGGVFSLGGLAVIGLASSLPRLGAAHVVVALLCGVLLLVDASQGAPLDRGTEEGFQPAWVEGEAAALDRAQDASGVYRFADLRPDGSGAGSRHRRRDIMIASSRGASDLGTRLQDNLPDFPRLLEQLNVRFVLASTGGGDEELPSLALAAVRDGVEGIEEEEGILRLPSPTPRAYWVPFNRIERAADADAALRMAGSLAPAPVAILDGAMVGPDLGQAPDLTVSSEAERPAEEAEPSPELVTPSHLVVLRERVIARIEASEPGLLVVNEAWAPGWRATIAGTEVPIYRVNGVVRGVFVGDGPVDVEMAYSPLLTVVLRWLAFGCLALCLLSFLLGALRRGKKKQKQ